jgi:putative cell wall-binding protein
MFFRIIPKFMEQMKNNITPMGIKNTALEIINLVEIFNLEKNIFPPYPILRLF